MPRPKDTADPADLELYLERKAKFKSTRACPECGSYEFNIRQIRQPEIRWRIKCRDCQVLWDLTPNDKIPYEHR